MHQDGRVPTQDQEEIKIASVPGQSLTGHLANVGEVTVLSRKELNENPYKRESTANFLASGHCYSLLAIPIRNRKEDLAGLFTLLNKKNRDGLVAQDECFGIRDRELAENLAGKLSLLIENLREFELIRRMMHELSGSNSIEQSLQIILSFSQMLTHADRGDLALWSQTRGDLVIAGATHSHERTVPKWEIAPRSGVIYRCWEMARDKEHADIIIDDVTQIEGYHSCDLRTASELAVTIPVGRRPIGVLNVESYEKNWFDQRDARALQVLAEHAGLAIPAARQPVDRLSYVIAPDRRLVLEFLRSVLQMYRLDGGVVFAMDRKRNMLHGVANVPELSTHADLELEFTLDSENVIPSILRSREYRRFEHASDFAKHDATCLERLQITGTVGCIPVMKGEEPIGVFQVWSKAASRRFSTSEEVLTPISQILAGLMTCELSREQFELLSKELESVRDDNSGSEFARGHYRRIGLLGVVAAQFARGRLYQFQESDKRFSWLYSFGHRDRFAVFREERDVLLSESAYAHDLAGRSTADRSACVYDPNDPTFFGANDSLCLDLGKNRDLPWAVVPIFAGGKLVGQFAADNRVRTVSIDQQRLDTLTALGLSLGNALELARRHPAEELRASLLRNIPLVSWKKDREGCFTEVNELFWLCLPEAKRAEIGDRAALIGMSDADIFPDEAVQRFRRGDEIAMKEGQYEDSGEPFPGFATDTVHVFKRALYNENYEVVGTEGFFFDVTRDRYRRLFDLAPFGFFETDSGGRFVHANRAFVELLQTNLAALVGKHVNSFVREETKNSVTSFFSDLVKRPYLAKTSKSITLVCPSEKECNETTTVPVTIECRPLQDSRNNITGTLAVAKSLLTKDRFEATLRDPTPHYLEYIKQSSLPVFCKDTKGVITYANKPFAEDAGVDDPADLIGVETRHLVTEENYDVYKRGDDAALAGNVYAETEVHESEIRSAYEVEVLKFPLKDSSGEIIGLQGVFWDVQTHASAVAELEQAFARAVRGLVDVFENALEGIYQSTPEGTFKLANQAMADILGYDSVEELRDVDIPTKVYLPGTRRQFLDQMKEQGEVRGLVSQVLKKNGERIWISESAREVTPTDGNSYYEGTILDVTDRQRRELQVASWKKSLDEMRDVSIPYFQFEAETTKTLEALLGDFIKRTEATNKNRGGAIAIYASSRLPDLEAIAFELKFSAGEGAYRHKLFEKFNLRRDDIPTRDSPGIEEITAAELRHVILPDPDVSRPRVFVATLTPSRWSVMICDIQSDQQLVEAFLSEFAHSLAAGERIRELRYFYEDLRHSLSNPIQGLLNRLGTLREDALEESNLASKDVLDWHNAALDEVDELSQMLGKLASATRKLGRFSFDRTTKELSGLHAVIFRAAKQYENKAERRGIAIKIHESVGELPPVYCDRERLRHLFANLIENAVKYSHSNRDIDIDGQTIDDAQGNATHVEIYVRDFGLGIPESDYEKIFEEGYQVPIRDQVRTIGGTGMGLYFVKDIVNAHSGKIKVTCVIPEHKRIRSDLTLEQKLQGCDVSFTVTLPIK